MQSLNETDIIRLLDEALDHNATEPALEYPQLLTTISGDPRSAAVLMPLICKETGWEILFTRRNAGLPEHSGQVAFPGGRVEPEDISPEDTALRESFEEIGLNPQDVRLLGRLRDYITITNYRVTPIVGSIPWPYPFVLAEEEVARIFTIPLEWLAEPSHYEEKTRPLPQINSSIPVIYYHPYDGEILWGASARLTLALIKALDI